MCSQEEFTKKLSFAYYSSLEMSETRGKSFSSLIFCFTLSVSLNSNNHDNSRTEGRGKFVLVSNIIFTELIRFSSFKTFLWKCRISEKNLIILWEAHEANELKIGGKACIYKLHLCAMIQSFSTYHSMTKNCQIVKIYKEHAKSLKCSLFLPI